MTSHWANNLSRPHIGPLCWWKTSRSTPRYGALWFSLTKTVFSQSTGWLEPLILRSLIQGWWAEWDFSLLYLIWGGRGLILPVGCNNLEMDIWSLRFSDCNNIIMISHISCISLIASYVDIICLGLGLEARHGFIQTKLIFNIQEWFCQNIAFAQC